MDYEDQPNYKPMEPAFAPVGKLADVARFPNPQLSQGLCPTCRNSGFVGRLKRGSWGIDLGEYGLTRCACTHGDRIRERDARR